jgi:two-component system OmpR family sensor kinase
MKGTSPSFSLQRTLAIRFALTMFVGLLGLTLWGYLGVRRTLMQQFDDTLRASARLQVNQIAALAPSSGKQSFPLDCFIRDNNRFVAVRDSAGLILASNNQRAGDLPLQAVAFHKARHKRPSFITDLWQGRSFRSIYVGMPEASSRPGAVIQVTASLASVEGSLHTILLQMLGTVLLATLATGVGAAWLAGSAIGPVREITRQARGITGAKPGQRITAHVDVREFHGLTEVLNAMMARLERAAQWHRRIIRDLGHDLRTPVTAMRAGVEVALWSERSPDDYRRILSSTMEEIDRLSLICDALVLLGRLEAGEVTLNEADIDGCTLMREAVAGIQEGLVEHQIRLVQPDHPVVIRADARLMKMVFEQLLDNARRYTPPGSRIELAVRSEGQEAILSVEDNGSGVAEEVLPHLFEPFYRSDAARAREGGPGLGLTATASIVALHGGTVAASRGRDGGLCVTVTLPRVNATPAAEAAKELSVLPVRVGSASSRQVTHR